MTADYDIFAGIHEKIQTLEGFHSLLEQRHVAGYDRDERLNQWVLFDGAILLDACGNAGRSQRSKILKGDLYSLGDFQGMYKSLSEDAKEGVYMSYGHGAINHYPHPGMVCPECGEPWTIANFLESHSTHKANWVDCLGKVGEMSIGMKVSEWEEKESSPEEFVILHLRRDDRQVKYDPDNVIEEGDEGHVYRWKFHHPECLRLKVTCEMRERFDEILEKAGFKYRLFTAVKNEYWGYPEYSKWFQIQTELTDMKIGWRKSVISVSCDAVDMAGLTSDTPTKGSDYIHAHGYEKLQEYMTELYNQLKK